MNKTIYYGLYSDKELEEIIRLAKQTLGRRNILKQIKEQVETVETVELENKKIKGEVNE